MVEAISDVGYWRDRLHKAKLQHHAIYMCGQAEWDAIADKHREILAKLVGAHDSVLDAGCGWGRMLTLMPTDWSGDYCGIDLSPDFIRMAKTEYPQTDFQVGDLRDLSGLGDKVYDWAILISIRRMVINNMGQSAWDQMEGQLKQHARRLLFLDYERDNVGEVILSQVE